MATQASLDLAQQMYVAYYGRPADQAGLDFWAEQFDMTDDLDAALTAFGDSAEYTAAFEFFNTTGLVTNLFRQMFGHDPDEAGLAFYVDRLDSGAATLASIAKQIADGATGTDATALANKVDVAADFTAAVTAAEAVYDADSIAAVQAILAAVDDTAASVTDAADEIADFTDANPAAFVLTDALADLSAAEAAVAAFLVTADGDDDATTSATEAEVNAASNTALDVVDDTIAAATAAADDDYLTAATTAGQEAVAAALLATAEATLAADLVTAQAALDAANEAVADVDGLAGAVATWQAATAAKAATDAAEVAALADALGEEVTYETNSGDTVTGSASADTAITALNDGTDDLIVTVSGALAFNDDYNGTGDAVTEADFPGVTALLAAASAHNAAVAAGAAADTALATALDVIENLQAAEDALTELEDVYDAVQFVDIATADAPTDAEMAAEQASADAAVLELIADLEALTFDTDDTTSLAAIDAVLDAVDGDLATGGGLISAGELAEANTAADAAAGGTISDQDDMDLAIAAVVAELTDGDSGAVDEFFEDLVDTYNTAATDTTLMDAVVTATSDVESAASDIEDLAEEVALADAAIAAEAALEVLTDAVDDAEAVFTAAEVAVPETLDSAVKAATSGDDIFLAGSIDSQILSFGLLGDDILSIGSGYTLNAGDSATDGDDAVLEVFVTASGADTIIQVETSVFGSNAASPEMIEITLTGVASTDVTVGADGIITA